MDPIVYSGSQAVTRSNADIFTLPSTDVSVLSSNYIVISPSYNIKDLYSPIHFAVPPSSQQYMDLASSFLHLKVKILKKDGTALSDSDNVAPSSMFFYTIFKNCIFSINGKVVSDNNNLYTYQAGIHTILTNGRGVKEGELSSILYYKDTAPDSFDASTNNGFKFRKELASKSKVFDMVGQIPVNMCQQEKYLPTSCALTFEFRYQVPEFCLDSNVDTTSYIFQVELAELYIRMHTMNPKIIANHNEMFTKARAEIQFKHNIVRTASVPVGSLSFMSESLLNGKLPTSVVLGMVSGKAFLGNYTKDPWNFQHFGLTSITLSINNDPALTRTIHLDFINNAYMLGYQTLWRPFGYEDGNGISRQDFATGNTLFFFDISETIGPELHIEKYGQIKVSLQFAAATTETINLLMFATLENVLELDAYRNVYLNHLADI